jgi:hypothetical protein
MSKDAKLCRMAHDLDECRKLEARLGTFQCLVMTKPMGTSSGKAIGMILQLKVCAEILCKGKGMERHHSIECAGK